MDIELLKQYIHQYAKADFSRSGGPGGQNVNKVNTKVILRLNINNIPGLYIAEQNRLRDTLASRINKDGELVISSDEERSQKINLDRAYLRMENLIIHSARLPRIRRPTKPGKAAIENRLNAKRIHSRKKEERRSGRNIQDND